MSDHPRLRMLDWCPFGCGNPKQIGMVACGVCFESDLDPETLDGAERVLLWVHREQTSRSKPVDAPRSPQPGASFTVTAPRHDPGAAHETFTSIIFGRRRA
jgi:hypothetical protein